MKFRLTETFSKSMPDWLKDQFIAADRPTRIIKHIFSNLDLNRAKFVEIPLPADAEIKKKIIVNWIDKIDKDPTYTNMLFILMRVSNHDVEENVVFSPKSNDTYNTDDGVLRYLAIEEPERILAACYAYDWAKDNDVARQRFSNKLEHDKLIDQGNERISYNGLPLKNLVGIPSRGFDASGYLTKPEDYYYDKLLSYQRKDYAKALVDIYDKLMKASAEIKQYAVNDADLLDEQNSAFLDDLIKSLRIASRIYNRVSQLIELSDTEQEIDELFEPHGDFSILNRKVKQLSQLLRRIEYTDFDW